MNCGAYKHNFITYIMQQQQLLHSTSLGTYVCMYFAEKNSFLELFEQYIYFATTTLIKKKERPRAKVKKSSPQFP